MKKDSISTCSRCGKPTKVVKTWIEVIETRAGESKLTHTQLACTDDQCERDFEKKTAEEIRKREALKMRNEAYASKKNAEKQSAPGTAASEKKKQLR